MSDPGKVLAETTAARARPSLPLRPLQVLVAVFVIGKLVLLTTGSTFQDEAYYWLWGLHPALSYYDHPPLNAWLQGLSGAIFGWNTFALRLPVALALLADIGLLWLISRRIAWDWPEHFWATVLLFLATPIFFAVTAVALPDHLLVTFSLAALYFFIAFLQRWPDLPRWRDLYLGAACLGMAALAKYNAVFIGLGLALAILILPRLRPLLARPQLYLAAAIALGLQAPVLIWNVTQSMASFGFILGGRHAGVGPGFEGVGAWLVGLLLLVGPLLLVPMVAFAFGRGRDSAFPRTVFWISSIAIFAISTVTATLFHWNLVAYLAALPFLILFLRWSWLVWAQAVYGAIFLGFMIVNYGVTPLTPVAQWRDEATGWAYGWDDAAAAVRLAREAHQAGFVATADYTTAALLAHALTDRTVTSLSPRRDQFDYWFDATAHTGDDAILLGDMWRPLTDAVTSQFEEVTALAEIPVVRGGQEVNRFLVYLGEDFRPAR